jgi:hypothetical protein
MIKTLLFYALSVLMLLNMYSCNERADKAKEGFELKGKSLQTKIGEKFMIGNVLDFPGS